MTRFRDMPINRKLTVVILLTCAGVLLLAGAAMVATEVVTFRRSLIEDMNVLGDLVARNSSAPLAFHRDEDLDEQKKILAALEADPHIISAGVYDRRGKLFGEYVRPGANWSFPSGPPEIGHRFRGGYLETVLPVYWQNDQLGVVVLHADLGRMYGQITLHATIIGAILLAIIIATFAISPRLRRPIAEPILALARVARRVAQDKDYSARATRHSADEVGLLTDAFNQMLSEVQLAHNNLAIAKDSAESANRAKDQFLAVLSHELRTPLTPVLLSLSLLQKLELSPEVREELATIGRQVELEARLIDDLLDITRITRGKLQLNFEITDIHRLIADAIKICCTQRAADMTTSLDATHHHVRADPGRLLQVFWNLLNNAVKFTPAGKRISVRTSNPAPQRIRVEIVDAGQGIAPEMLPRIFQPFEQASSPSDRRFGGLGLGLAIAKALVTAHSGTLSVRSEGEGAGAAFTIELMTAESIVGVQEGPNPAPVARHSDARPKLRILLVEDHEPTLKLMTRLLRGLGHEVQPASSVGEALLLVERQSRFDLLVSDLGLPDGTGLDLIRQLRKSRDVPGICLSGYGMEEDLARSADAGFGVHLVKPIDMGKLEEAIESMTAGRTSEPVIRVRS